MFVGTRWHEPSAEVYSREDNEPGRVYIYDVISGKWLYPFVDLETHVDHRDSFIICLLC